MSPLTLREPREFRALRSRHGVVPPKKDPGPQVTDWGDDYDSDCWPPIWLDEDGEDEDDDEDLAARP